MPQAATHPLVRSFLRASRWRPSTQIVAVSNLNRYCAHLEAAGVKLTDATEDDVVAYLETRADRAPSTRANEWKAIRALYRWAVAEGECDRDPARRIAGPIVTETPVRDVTESEVHALCRACDRRTTIGRRDEAIILVLWWTGLRKGELRALDIGSVDLDAARVTVGTAAGPTKTGRVRRTPITLEAVDALDRYLRRRPDGDDPTAPLFVSTWDRRISATAIDTILARRAAGAGIPRRISAHEFRRAYAIRHKRAGGSDPTLMANLGWRTVGQINRYTRMHSEELADVEYRRLFDATPRRRRRRAV